MAPLPQRRETILRIVIGEYTASGFPIASESIARNYALGVSSATIRNEIARLEEEGYITHPHTSAGSTPSDKGYRYYVESLLEGPKLPEEEQYSIQLLFQQVKQELEEWARLTVEVLAERLRNIALVTLPWATEYHFKHLDLVEMQDFLALLVLVLQEAKIKQQVFPLEQAMSQDELTALANRLNVAYKGLTCSQIGSQKLAPSPIEQQISDSIMQLMEAEGQQEYEELYFYGLRHLLSQPEFSRSERMLKLLELLEKKSIPKSVLSPLRSDKGIQVTIGKENKEETLQECSVVLGNYGIPGETMGSIGVIGPTRMSYNRAISTVRYLSSVMTELMTELYA